MKIAIDCHTLEIKNWAGKEQYLMSVLKALSEESEKHEYILYFRKKVFSDGRFSANWRICNINVPTPFWQIAVIIDMFFKKIDVVLCPCTYLLPALNYLVPSVVVVHDLTTFLPGISKTHTIITKLRERLVLKLAIKRSEKVIAVSESTKKDLIDFFKIKPEKIEVVLEAAHSQYRLIGDKEKIKEVLFKYKLPQDFILFVGTLEPRKNLVKLIEAYKKIIDAGLNNYKLALVGKKGWYYEEIFKKVKDLELEKDVIFLGYVPDEDVPYLYNTAVCFIYPSLYEGFGLPVLEAMTCGCPVITSNNSSLPEVAGEAGILINEQSAEDMSEALKKVLSDSILREKMREDGLKQAEKFSWGRAAQEMLIIFKKIK